MIDAGYRETMAIHDMQIHFSASAKLVCVSHTSSALRIMIEPIHMFDMRAPPVADSEFSPLKIAAIAHRNAIA
jgi:hypothetical protein